MRTRTHLLIDLALLSLVVVLVLIAYFQPGIEKPKPLPVLTSLEPGAVRRIEVDYPGQEPIVLVKEKDTWRLTQPLHMPANRFRAETLADLAQAGSLAQYPVAKLDLAALKLDKPLLKVRLNGTEVVFGDAEPLSGRRYALIDGTVHLITDRIAELLNGDVAEYVSNALLPEAAHPTEIDLPLLAQGGDDKQPFGPQVQLRFQDNRWTMAGAGKEVSQDLLNRLVDGWRFASALEVKRADKDHAVLGKATLKLEGEPSPLVFEIAAVKPQPTLVRPDVGLQYVLSEPLAERLFQLKPPPKTAAHK
jgi:hypothetical protein